MEEEETVISTWNRSEHNAALKDSVEKRRLLQDDTRKENVDVNKWRSEKDLGKEIGIDESEEDEVTLDDDTLSRLIEGDARDVAHHGPKPKPRHRELSNSDRKTSADKLFSADKEKSNDKKTSPRPTPRTRAKPKEPSTENQQSLFLNSSLNKLSADKLFDSIGKGNKSVSFGDIAPHDDLSTSNQELNNIIKFAQGRERRISKENEVKKRDKSSIKNVSKVSARDSPKDQGQKQSSELGKDKQQKIPPKRPERTGVKPDFTSKQNSKEDAVDHSSGHSSELQKLREEFRRHGTDKSDQTSSSEQHKETLDKESKKQPDVNDLFGPKQNGFVEHNTVKETTNQKSESLKSSDQNYGDYARNDTSKNKHVGDKKEELDRSGNQGRPVKKGMVKEKHPTDMFEEHVPKIEHVIHHPDDRNKKDSKLGGILKRNAPLKAERRIEEMTKTPELYDFQYESRDVPQRHSTPEDRDYYGMRRSSSLNNLSDTRLQFEEDLNSSGLPSSRGIRDAVYNEWLEKKKSNLKEKSRKKVEEKKKEEENAKEKMEKEIVAKKAFEAWSSGKERVLKEGAKKKKELLNKTIDDKREKTGKQLEAKKFFESWKSKKDVVLKECIKEKREKEKEAKHKKIEDEQEKVVIAKKSYERWKQRKDEQIKDGMKTKRKEELTQSKYELEIELDKRQDNEKAFREFLNKKGTTKRRPPSPSLTQRAWSPGGITRSINCIPEKIQPVVAVPKINRARSFSGTTTSTSFHNTGRRTSKHW